MIHVFIILFILFTFIFSAAPDPSRGQNMTIISADRQILVYLSAGMYLIVIWKL